MSVYAPQRGLSDVDKDFFYDQLNAITATIQASELLIPCGDWNGHVGSTGTGFREVHGGLGYGRLDPDTEGERIQEYALAHNFLLGNTCFRKWDSHLITYKSGNTATHIDFILFRKTMHRHVTDEVLPGEEVALQHQLLVCDIRSAMPSKTKRKFSPHLKVWKLKDPETCSRFQEVFSEHMLASESDANSITEEVWASSKQVYRRQLRCVAQHGHINGDVKPGGGAMRLKGQLWQKDKHSRLGRLAREQKRTTWWPSVLQGT
ncbi:craniofacial development protein 2-like [Ostrea edulis]|uniref:craniofacial development protein 2-like n=1 Tax=Ostrea edulis TaxID=37623 RepID=UPI0024AF3F81|nr:craniofacial development protein 2-like [Ostrea edulis]